MDGGLKIEGLDAFRKDLRRANKDLPKSIQRAFKVIAEDALKKVEAGFRARGPIGEAEQPTVQRLGRQTRSGSRERVAILCRGVPGAAASPRRGDSL